MQKAFSFDKTTLKKILKGALIAATGSAAIGLLQYMGGIHIDDPYGAAFVAWFVPTFVNIIKEWMAGQKR